MTRTRNLTTWTSHGRGGERGDGSRSDILLLSDMRNAVLEENWEALRATLTTVVDGLYFAAQSIKEVRNGIGALARRSESVSQMGNGPGRPRNSRWEQGDLFEGPQVAHEAPETEEDTWLSGLSDDENPESSGYPLSVGSTPKRRSPRSKVSEEVSSSTESPMKSSTTPSRSRSTSATTRRTNNMQSPSAQPGHFTTSSQATNTASEESSAKPTSGPTATSSTRRRSKADLLTSPVVSSSATQTMTERQGRSSRKSTRSRK